MLFVCILTGQGYVLAKNPGNSSSTRGTKDTDEAQTVLDVSKGNIRIKTTGAQGGGLSEDETKLNPAGYRIIGTTSSYNITVEKGVKTDLTLDGVDITCNTTNLDCLNVSHADVTITLTGHNELKSNAGTSGDVWSEATGNAVTKDGMDGVLTIQCEHADEAGHKCSKETCGSLLAQGNSGLYHAGGIGSSFRNANKSADSGFSNLYIKGGIIDALAGKHSPGIGSACRSEGDSGTYTKNISISGGIITAKGNDYCSGIGSGIGNKVDGIYITNGTIKAEGGRYAPGIGASQTVSGLGSMITCNIKISGGDTVVTAIGDSTTNMPGIGSGGGTDKVSNVTAVPDEKYQGYIQDGVSLTNYTFMDGTPFQKETNIRVEKFYTQVYFGPFRDANGIDKDTKEQIGGNHVISKTGGNGFTKDQMKQLTKITGKQADGQNFSVDLLTFADPEELEAINDAKINGRTGDYSLTFTTPGGTKATVIVSLRDDGSDAEKLDPDHPDSLIGANNFKKETGGSEFTEEQVKEYGQLKAKDQDGNNIDLKDFIVDSEQLDKINQAKTAGKSGEFELTFRAPDGGTVTVTVSLTGEYDSIAEDSDSGERIKAKNIISKTGGSGFTKDQLKELAYVKAVDKDGNEISREQIVFLDEAQVKAVNNAKTAGETGGFPLTFKTPSGTEVTVRVMLRQEGTDTEKYHPDQPSSSIGADNGTSKTGGTAFTEDEIRELCRAEGKDKNGDNVLPTPDPKQLEAVNKVKKAGKTGTFDMTFSLKDGTKAVVKITLTGTHKVSFDSKGGDNTPKPQNIEGGGCVLRPDDPEKEGFVFEGWYYTGEDGKERLWDFSTPVHEDINLYAKWKKQNSTASQEDEKKTDLKKGGTKKKKTEKLPNWNFQEPDEVDGTGGSYNNRAPKTSDTAGWKKMLGLFAAACAGGVLVQSARKKYSSR
ncbi:MAG: InlB B-repeat-containing protein [Anaerostipes sp.]|nr:InlB B-repeat-containing protein [Anaerostipes sp.]